jgi:hypothetical protein
MPRFQAAGPSRLAELRAQGANPSATPQAQEKRRATMKARAEARSAWERGHPSMASDENTFRREVFPKLPDASLSAMMRATGLSIRYCAQVRRGARVHHPLYWPLLKGLLANPDSVASKESLEG